MFSYPEHMPDDTLLPLVGRNVRRLRTERRWSMRELATRMHVSAATISAIEHGQTGISLGRLTAIADAFAVDTSELMGAEQATPPEQSASTPDWRFFAPLPVDRVFTAAVASFTQTGYHGASMRDIAIRAGMSIPGIYHHHRSKQELFVHILDVTLDDLEWRLESARAEHADPVNRLGALVEALALFHMRRPDLAFLGASEMRSLEPPNRERIASRRASIQHMIDAEIDHSIAVGEAATVLPREVGRAIATMCTSLPQWHNPHGATPAPAIATEYAALALRMIGVRPLADATTIAH